MPKITVKKKSMPPFLPPNAAGIPSQLTVRMLLDMSKPNLELSKAVRAVRIDPITMDGCHGIIAKTVTNQGKGKPDTSYQQWIWVPDRSWGVLKNGKFSGKFWARPSPYVAVACTCPDHTYRWEYALTQVGASRIWFSNGDPPQTTNPSEAPLACKHLVRVMLEMNRRGM